MSGLIHRDQIERLLYLYDLAEVEDIRLQSIRAGSQHILVKARGQEYDLLVMDDRNFEEAIWQQQLLDQLARQGLPVCAPLRTLDGMPAALFRGSPVWLLQRPGGSTVREVNEAQLGSVGHFLAGMHEAARKIVFRSPPPDEWSDRLAPSSPVEDLWRDRARRLTEQLNLARLHEGCIHGAIKPASVLFEGDSISGLLDLVHSRQAPVILDLSLAAVNWCLTRSRVDETRLDCLLSAYREKAELGQADQDALPLAMMLAACLHWLRDRHLRSRFPEAVLPDADWVPVYEQFQTLSASGGI